MARWRPPQRVESNFSRLLPQVRARRQGMIVGNKQVWSLWVQQGLLSKYHRWFLVRFSAVMKQNTGSYVLDCSLRSFLILHRADSLTDLKPENRVLQIEAA